MAYYNPTLHKDNFVVLFICYCIYVLFMCKLTLISDNGMNNIVTISKPLGDSAMLLVFSITKARLTEQ